MLGRALFGNDRATVGCFNAATSFRAFSEVFWALRKFPRLLKGLPGWRTSRSDRSTCKF